ncbi:MAG: mannonate dehydratase [Kiritimatiellae bacterium]|nr:mannonate dehydratase [Kiritimatiellia bacterium]
MKQGWRWYGESDPISLKEIRQAGVTDVVTALYGRKPGETWPVAEIRRLAKKVRDAGMTWSVVESVPVHEDVKKRTGDFRRHVANYRKTLENLAACGVKTVCYNFMPVLDWTRSDLAHELPDGSTCLGYNAYEVAAFDLFALKRPDAAKDYDAKTKARAKRLWAKYSPKERMRVQKAILTGLPGTVDDLTPAQFLRELKTYAGVDDARLRANLYAFLNDVTPTLEKCGVDLCIHPDDPPHPIFGLPRVLSTAADVRRMVKACPSKHVGLTLCTGSLGASPENDEVAIFREFAERVFFCHFRNLEYEEEGVFHESRCHLVGKTNMPELMLALLREEKRRGADIVVRPDHGRLMEIDKRRNCYCGYSYGGRLVGLAELRGLEIGLKAFSRGV